MIQSRATFATIEAAAIDAHWASPLTMPCCLYPRPGTVSASTSTMSGQRPRPSTARFMARNVARSMFRRSISSTSAKAMHTARASALMRAACFSRWRAVRRFESSRPLGSKPSPRTTAAAATGPQSAPRPTSSMPATRRWPAARASSSYRVPQQSSTPLKTRGRRPGFRAPLPAAIPPPELVFGRGFRPLLLHPPRLPLPAAQVVELGPPHPGLLHHLDLLDGARVEGEDALHSRSERHLAHGHRRPRPRSPEPDHQALEDLDALALRLLGLALDLLLDRGLLDPHVHPHGVAGGEAGQALLEVARLDAVDGIHVSLPICERCVPGGRRPSPRPRSRAGAARPPRRGGPARGGPPSARASPAAPASSASGGSRRGRRRAGPRGRRGPARAPAACSGASRGGRPRTSPPPLSPRARARRGRGAPSPPSPRARPLPRR